MAWTNPKTWATGEALTASDLNLHLRDNLLYLFNRPIVIAELRNAANITISSSTMVAVDDNFYNLDLEVNSGRAKISLIGGTVVQTSGAHAIFDLLIDNTTYLSSNTGTPDTNGSQYIGSDTTGAAFPLSSFQFIVTGLSAGSHNFKLRFRSSSGANITFVRANTRVVFMAEELP